MKKVVSFFIVTALLVSMVFAQGSTESKNKIYRFLSGTGVGTSSYEAVNSVIEQYKKEVNANFNVEWEVITSTSDLWQKLQMYNTANDLPDMFSISNGTLSESMIEQGKLANITEILKKTGHDGEMADALVDYLTSSDGKLYMFPSGFNSEFFVYRKPVFEKYGLEVPETWEDFLNICEVLKVNGEIPYVMRGADYVQYLRFLSFPTWTTYGREFIIGLVNGKYTYTESNLGAYAGELMKKLGGSGYFVPGYENMALTDVVDTFNSGVGVMMYTNSNYVKKLNEQYENGEIGFFEVPTVEGIHGTGSNMPTHAGKAWGISSETYKNDEEFRNFVDYLFEHLDQAYYDNGALSWYKSEIPEGSIPSMLADLAVEMKKQKISWISWDDKLSAATTTAVGDAGAKLAYGSITVADFCKIFDDNLKKNDL